jgi:ATP-dependent Zn protease
VVPLPDGKTIPVQMVGNEEQMSMMTAQLDRLDQMVRIMQTQVGVSEQILKYAQ